MKIGLVVPEHGRASQNGRSFRPSLRRRRLQSPETGSCGELQVKVAASKTAFRKTKDALPPPPAAPLSRRNIRFVAINVGKPTAKDSLQ